MSEWTGEEITTVILQRDRLRADKDDLCSKLGEALSHCLSLDAENKHLKAQLEEAKELLRQTLDKEVAQADEIERLKAGERAADAEIERLKAANRAMEMNQRLLENLKAQVKAVKEARDQYRYAPHLMGDVLDKALGGDL